MRVETERTKRMGSWFFRFRGAWWTLFFLIIFFLASPTKISLGWGLFLVSLGQILRFYSVGFIRRYRGESVKAEKLVTWGPFAWVRNPLYIGNGLIGLGWSIIAGNLFVVILFCLLFWILYVRIIIPHEEAFLEETFGKVYENYREKTGMLFPRRIPSLEEQQGPFHREILWESERHSLYITLLGTLLLGLKYLW